MKTEKKQKRKNGEKKRKYFFYNDGFVCSNPCAFGVDQCDDKNDHEIMRFDLRKVRESDIILVNLKDIRNSIGTSDEILYGFISQKPVIGFIESEKEMTKQEIMDYIHKWKFEQIDRIETGENAQLKAMEYILFAYGA